MLLGSSWIQFFGWCVVDALLWCLTTDPLEVLNLRMKGSLTGEGGGYDWERLSYLSLHTLDTPTGCQYARMRINRELLDAWLSKRISFAGKKFDDAEIKLTAEDLSSVFLLTNLLC